MLNLPATPAGAAAPPPARQRPRRRPSAPAARVPGYFAGMLLFQMSR